MTEPYAMDPAPTKLTSDAIITAVTVGAQKDVLAADWADVFPPPKGPRPDPGPEPDRAKAPQAWDDWAAIKIQADVWDVKQRRAGRITPDAAARLAQKLGCSPRDIKAASMATLAAEPKK